jgi:hypothetical protein
LYSDRSELIVDAASRVTRRTLVAASCLATYDVTLIDESVEEIDFERLGRADRARAPRTGTWVGRGRS